MCSWCFDFRNPNSVQSWKLSVLRKTVFTPFSHSFRYLTNIFFSFWCILFYDHISKLTFVYPNIDLNVPYFPQCPLVCTFLFYIYITLICQITSCYFTIQHTTYAILVFTGINRLPEIRLLSGGRSSEISVERQFRVVHHFKWWSIHVNTLR